MEEHSDIDPKALAMADALFPATGRKRLRMLADLDPEYARIFADFAYAGLYTRQVLDQRTRELCAVAALAVRPYPNQLASHIRAALLAGATRQEVAEVIMQVSVYGGFPATLSGFDVMHRVYAELVADTDKAEEE